MLRCRSLHLISGPPIASLSPPSLASSAVAHGQLSSISIASNRLHGYRSSFVSYGTGARSRCGRGRSESCGGVWGEATSKASQPDGQACTSICVLIVNSMLMLYCSSPPSALPFPVLSLARLLPGPPDADAGPAEGGSRQKAQRCPRVGAAKQRRSSIQAMQYTAADTVNLSALSCLPEARSSPSSSTSSMTRMTLQDLGLGGILHAPWQTSQRLSFPMSLSTKLWPSSPINGSVVLRTFVRPHSCLRSALTDISYGTQASTSDPGRNASTTSYPSTFTHPKRQHNWRNV